MRDAFSVFDQDKCNYVTKEAFANAIEKLGFQGEGAPALTGQEIDLLIDSADKNGDGLIDYKEFCDRFWIAAENVDTVNNVIGKLHQPMFILTLIFLESLKVSPFEFL